MSEIDDKPEPTQDESAASRPTSVSPSVDSDWDALLGSSDSASNRPIFAPPGGKKPRRVAPEPRPRTSGGGASVSGEFEVVERPEPAMPTRQPSLERLRKADEREPEPSEYQTARLQIVPRTITLDDEDREPSGERPEPAAAQSVADDDAEPAPAPERRSGSRNLVLIVGAIAAVASIAVLVQSGRDDEDRDRVGSNEVEPVAKGASETGASEVEPSSSETTSNDSTGETGAGETGGETEPKPRPSHVNPRDPSLIPPGTPEENAKAFLKLPVSIHDGPPIGGIGRTGIHVDAVSTGRGRDNTDCVEPTQRFSVSADEYVNVCFRVVHPREQESLRVIWEKDGKVTRRGRVRIPELRAYTTRAYLLLRPEYIGSWKVRIVPDGEEHIDLVVAEFEITE